MKWALVRFLLVGGIGFVVDAGLVYLLTSHGTPPVAARVPAISAAILTTWLLNRSFTFRVSARRSRAELARYIIVALSSAALNFGLYSVLTLLGVAPVAAVALATAALLLYSFVGYRRFAFNAGRTKT